MGVNSGRWGGREGGREGGRKEGKGKEGVKNLLKVQSRSHSVHRG